MGIAIEPNRALTSDFQHQLRIARKLMEYATKVVTSAKPEDDISGIDHRRKTIVMALGGKSFRTFNTIIDSLEKQHADDAGILNRALYESALIATYLLDAPAQVIDDYSDYFMFKNWNDHKLFAEVDPTTAANAFPLAVLQEMEAQHNSVLGRYPNGRWSSLSVEAMARTVDNKLPRGFKVFTFTYGAIYRQSSAYVHSDVRSIQSTMVNPGFVGRIITPAELGKQMYLANFLMITLCFVVFGSLFGPKFVPEHNALVLEWNGNRKPDEVPA